VVGGLHGANCKLSPVGWQLLGEKRLRNRLTRRTELTYNFHIPFYPGNSMPEPARPLRVFLCHASGDKPAVRALYRRLKADGVAAWLDEEDLYPGDDWQLKIPEAVHGADVVIICLSCRSVSKVR
jgi:hypothetical protein